MFLLVFFNRLFNNFPPPPSAAADTIVADLKTKLADAKKDLVAANAKTEVAKTKAKNAEEEKDEAVKEKVAAEKARDSAEKATEAAAAEKKNWIAAALKKEKKDRVEPDPRDKTYAAEGRKQRTRPKAASTIYRQNICRQQCSSAV